MDNPLISIIVPCHNQAQYLDEALQSVLNQIYENWECIVINDGSTDYTEKLAEKWLIRDARFKYLFQKKKGVSSARNLGIATSKGELILPLDADDKISNDYINLAIIAFQENPELKLVYCKAEKFGEEVGSWILNSFSLYNLSLKNMIFCSALFRKEEWEMVGGYDENMVCGIEDWEFWIAILKKGGQVKCLDIIGFFYRVKKVSRHTKFNEHNEKELLEYMNVKHADFFVKQLGSLTKLSRDFQTYKNINNRKLNSKKFILNLFFKTFFGIQLFKDKKY